MSQSSTFLTYLLSYVSSTFHVLLDITHLHKPAASNWVLKKFRPSRWLPFLVVMWGTVTTLSGLVQNYSGLLAIRFFLGLCEGGLLPGIVCILESITAQSRVLTFMALDAVPEYALQAS